MLKVKFEDLQKNFPLLGHQSWRLRNKTDKDDMFEKFDKDDMFDKFEKFLRN